MQEFEALYKEYYVQVYKYVLKLCKDKELAEEITQEAFFKVLKSSSKFKGECKFSVWVCQIAKNTFLSYIKKNKYRAEFSIDALTLEVEDNPENKAVDKVMVSKIYEILETMDEPYKEVFWQRTICELSFGEIAKHHKKSENWARVTYHRAKMRIREALK